MKLWIAVFILLVSLPTVTVTVPVVRAVTERPAIPELTVVIVLDWLTKLGPPFTL